MDKQRAIQDASVGLRIAVIGAVLAATLGVEAGAALRPGPEERSAPPPPQLMVVDDPELVALEDAGAGWPGRHPG